MTTAKQQRQRERRQLSWKPVGDPELRLPSTLRKLDQPPVTRGITQRFACGPYEITLRLEARGALLEVASLAISAPEPASKRKPRPPITTSGVLRQLPLPSMVSFLRQTYVANQERESFGRYLPDGTSLTGRAPVPLMDEHGLRVDVIHSGYWDWVAKTATAELGELRGRGVKGRAPLTDEHYLQVAGVYTDALRIGESPNVLIAEVWGCSKKTAANWVNHARNVKHYLPPTTPGVPKGLEREEET